MQPYWLALNGNSSNACNRFATVATKGAMAEPQFPLEITLESIKVLSPQWQAEIQAMAKRQGFTLGSEPEPGTWFCGLNGFWWWKKS